MKLFAWGRHKRFRLFGKVLIVENVSLKPLDDVIAHLRSEIPAQAPMDR